jgi:hypothetical protein
VAVVLTLIQTKEIRIDIHKTIQKIQNTSNTSTHINKTPTHYKILTYTHQHITQQVKTNTAQDMHQMK